jgi:primosomal protein N''
VVVYFWQATFLCFETLVAVEKTEPSSYNLELKNRVEKVGLSGNWIKKLAWLREAVEYDAEVVFIQKEILNLRAQTYEPKIKNITDSLSQFKVSSKVGVDGFNVAISSLQDEIDERLNQIYNIIKQIDAYNLPQDSRYKIFEADDKISNYKDKLAALKMRVGFVEDLQKAFETRVTTLDNYIIKANEIAKLSTEKVKEVFSVFDHEKAKDLTFYIKGLSDNMKKILKYVKEDALNSFDSEQVALSKEIEKLGTDTTSIRTEFSKTSAEVRLIEQQLNLVSEKTVVNSLEETVIKEKPVTPEIASTKIINAPIQDSFFKRIFLMLIMIIKKVIFFWR